MYGKLGGKVRSHIWKVLSALGSPRKEAKAGVLGGCQAEEDGDQIRPWLPRVDTGESVQSFTFQAAPYSARKWFEECDFAKARPVSGLHSPLPSRPAG